MYFFLRFYFRFRNAENPLPGLLFLQLNPLKQAAEFPQQLNFYADIKKKDRNLYGPF
jgi:hypothetical protein